MESSIKSLQQIGLSEKEARIYTTLLSLGKGSAYAIAEKAKLKKPTTYVILGELISKGYVLRIPRVKKQLFTAISPDQFTTKIADRMSTALKLAPFLNQLYQSSNNNIRTLYFEGENGVRDALLFRAKEMKNTELVGFYGIADKLSPELVKIFTEFRSNLSDNHIRVRGIVPDHHSLKQYRKEDSLFNAKMKVLPYKAYSSNASIEAGDTFVRIVTFPDTHATIIENPHLARTVKQIFELVWNGRK